MTYQENKPYVVSADTKGLLKSWARESGLTLPSDDYFQGMLKDLESTLDQYFDQVDIVPEAFLRRGLNGLIKNSPVPVISLDRAYVNPKQNNLEGFLDVTRTVDANLNNTGLGSRYLEIALERQIKQLSARQSGRAIALVDDVIFEGKTILELVEKLRRRGVTVDAVYSGITIKEGQDLLEKNGVRVNSLIVYDQVTDEICERDFVVGTPYSGRSVVNGKGVIEGAPYLYPFGKPVEWASIPEEDALSFSLFCLYQSIQFWAKTEQLSCQNISPQQVSKPVFGLPENRSMSRAITDVMKELGKR
jgi:hypothetical protein